ncbi:hypothetical protein ALPR1_10515 [Algoriphagus machipongonensis]|uniref:Lmo0937 family membrane protein n=2 Tax=Algoriphagus TaxID=246875 RepID=A3HS24_9BACT|nr:hypothetical protein ALPR1_10515 [Algoriphagus machipongonensis]
MHIELKDSNKTLTKTTTTMSSLLYFIAVILLIGWLIGVFAYSATGLIHVLLVLAVIAVLFRLISGRGI